MARRRKFAVPQLTDDEYYAQLLKQHGGCWICGREPKQRRLAGDHSHRKQAMGLPISETRRGLLCFPCNRYVVGAIERFRLDPERVAEYFREFGL